jgi:hypothetical protein
MGMLNFIEREAACNDLQIIIHFLIFITFNSGGELAVMVELKHEIIARSQEELHEDDVFCLVENLVENMQQLVIYATNRLKSTRIFRTNIYIAFTSNT